jgi:hypothetical protein
MDLPGLSPAVFHFRHRASILLLSLPIALFSLARALAGLRSGGPWLNWLAALLLWVFLFVVALRRRLVIDHDGLHYTEFFSTDHIPWSHVTRLVSRRTLGIWSSEALEVRAGGSTARDLFIDLTQFGPSWRQGALGTILREKAPQLFQESVPPRSSG